MSYTNDDNDNNPAGRTILVQNLPIDIKHGEVIDVFSSVGLIEVSLNHDNSI